MLRFLLILSLASTGCAITPTLTTGYDPEPASGSAFSSVDAIAVIPFEEARPERYYASSGRLFLTYIPLIPYVSMPFERLDESIRIQSEALEKAPPRGPGIQMPIAPDFETYSYPNSFAAAVADDLASSGIFESADFLGPSATGADPREYRYVLTGTLHASELRNTTTSFGLGMAGVLLWFVPIPMSKATGEIDLELALTDQKTGKVIWQKRVQDEVHRYLTLYTSSAMLYGRGGAFSLNVYQVPSDAGVDRSSLFSWQFAALRKGMLEVRKEIADVIARNTD